MAPRIMHQAVITIVSAAALAACWFTTTVSCPPECVTVYLAFEARLGCAVQRA